MTVVSTNPTARQLDEIDRILGERSRALRLLDARAAELREHHRAFLGDFALKCTSEIIPAMEAIVDRLRRNGGGGTVDYQPQGGRTGTPPRLTLWMALEGEIDGSPRPDRYPYFQLDADVETMKVKVLE